jgi:hypothetical protein
MADRNSNLGGRSDESQNPDLGRDEDSGMSGSGSTSSDRGSDLGSSGNTGTSRDRGTSGEGGSESEGDLGTDEIGDENVSNR